MADLGATLPSVQGRLHRPAEDLQVWNLALDNVGAWLKTSDLCTDTYLAGFAWLDARRKEVPDLEAINDWLRPTGWQALNTFGYVDVKTYQGLLSKCICPVSWQMRRLRDLRHSAAPDFFHDVVGHLPMLFDSRYSALLQEWAERGHDAVPTSEDMLVAEALSGLIAARERDLIDPIELVELTQRLQLAQQEAVCAPSRHERLETFYTWAIEFGLVKLPGEGIKVIGAAILSSSGELERVLKGEVRFAPFAGQGVGTPVNYTEFQREMFVADTFGEYLSELRAI